MENSDEVVVKLSRLSPDVPVDRDCIRDKPAAVDAESVVGMSGRFESLRAPFVLNILEAFFFSLPARPILDPSAEFEDGRPG